MSALPHLFVLLACACAAAREALTEPPRGSSTEPPFETLTQNYDGYCITETRGYSSKITTPTQEILIPEDEKEFMLDIPNTCLNQSKELVGGVVSACDADAAPSLQLPPMVAGAGTVRRRGTRRAVAKCFVRLYCI